jgi:periodic tryptophan protein 1
VWNEDEDNLFVHHDILLDTFPLCVEWIGYDPGSENQRGNLVAVGSMQPDVSMSCEPTSIEEEVTCHPL